MTNLERRVSVAKITLHQCGEYILTTPFLLHLTFLITMNELRYFLIHLLCLYITVCDLFWLKRDNKIHFIKSTKKRPSAKKKHTRSLQMHSCHVSAYKLPNGWNWKKNLHFAVLCLTTAGHSNTECWKRPTATSPVVNYNCYTETGLRFEKTYLLT